MSSVEQKQPLSDGPDWSFELLGQYQAEMNGSPNYTNWTPTPTRLKSLRPNK